MKLKSLLLTLGATLAVGLGALAGVTSMDKGAKEVKAELSETTIYIDVSSSMWGSGNFSETRVYLFGGSDPANATIHWDSSTDGKGNLSSVTVMGKQYVSFSLSERASIGYTAMIVYAWNMNGKGNQTDNIYFTDFSAGQNLVTVKGTSAGWDGKNSSELGTLPTCRISLDLSGENWAQSPAGQYISVYFFKNDESASAWGEYVYVPYQQYYAEVEYLLTFTPDSMVAVRYSDQYDEETWKTDPWSSSHTYKDDNDQDISYKWGQTGNLSFSDNAHIIIASTSFVGVAYVYGKNSSYDWSSRTIADLNKIRLNRNNEIEYYNDVNLVLGGADNYNEFQVRISDWAGGWWGSDKTTISDNVPGDGTWKSSGESNYVVWMSGTAAITVRIVFNRHLDRVFVTSSEHGDADIYADQFLGGMTCSGAGAITKNSWSSLSTTFGSLSADTKNVLKDVAEDGNQTGELHEQAIARYDYIIKKYGTTAYGDFMDRATSQSISYPTAPQKVGLNVLLATNDSSTTLIIIAIAGVSLLAVAGFFLLKRKEER